MFGNRNNNPKCSTTIQDQAMTAEIPAGHFALKIDEVLRDNTIIFRWKVSCNGKPDRPVRFRTARYYIIFD